MNRRTPLKRSTTRIPARRAKPRRGPAGIPQDEWRNPAYVAFLHEHGRCTICEARCPDAAHSENNGMRSKGRDSSRAPLCRQCHTLYDAGRVEFERVYQVDMKREAAAWWKLFTIWRETDG